jgi:hypothetical protein
VLGDRHFPPLTALCEVVSAEIMAENSAENLLDTVEVTDSSSVRHQVGQSVYDRSAHSLIRELQSKLNITRRSGTGNETKCAALDIRIGKSEACVIESVEQLTAKLESSAIPEQDLLRDG